MQRVVWSLVRAGFDRAVRGNTDFIFATTYLLNWHRTGYHHNRSVMPPRSEHEMNIFRSNDCTRKLVKHALTCQMHIHIDTNTRTRTDTETKHRTNRHRFVFLHILHCHSSCLLSAWRPIYAMVRVQWRHSTLLTCSHFKPASYKLWRSQSFAQLANTSNIDSTLSQLSCQNPKMIWKARSMHTSNLLQTSMLRMDRSGSGTCQASPTWVACSLLRCCPLRQYLTPTSLRGMCLG